MFQVLSAHSSKNLYLKSWFDFSLQIKVIFSVICSTIMFFMDQVDYNLFWKSLEQKSTKPP